MNLDELHEIAEKQHEADAPFEQTVHVCVAASCLSSRSDQVKSALEAEVKARGHEHKCKVKGVGCMGLCAAGPLVESRTPTRTMYQTVTPEDAGAIIASLDAQPVERLVLPLDMPFFSGQRKIVLENSARSIRSALKTTSPPEDTSRWSRR